MLVLTYNYIRITKSLIKNFIIYSSIPEKKLFEYPQYLAIPFSKDALCQVWKILTKFFWKDKYENDIDNDNES